MSFPGDALGIAPHLCGKDHFPAIFCLLSNITKQVSVPQEGLKYLLFHSDKWCL